MDPFRGRLLPSDPSDSVGPFFGLDIAQLAINGGDERAEVLVAEGAGDEDTARVGPARSGQCTYERQEVGDVGGDEHPALGDGELQYVFVLETFEILFGVYGVDIVTEVP